MINFANRVDLTSFKHFIPRALNGLDKAVFGKITYNWLVGYVFNAVITLLSVSICSGAERGSLLDNILSSLILEHVSRLMQSPFHSHVLPFLLLKSLPESIPMHTALITVNFVYLHYLMRKYLPSNLLQDFLRSCNPNLGPIIESFISPSSPGTGSTFEVLGTI